MRAWFALIFAASGAAALVYEVTWTRLLTLQLGHGVAAASTVLAAFMGGLAAGSAAGGRAGARFSPAGALRVYAALEIAIAALALLLPIELRAFHGALAGAYADGDGGATFASLRLGTTLLLLAVPAAAMGATFPIASRWFVPTVRRAAHDAGVLYAANTVGAALGALAAGFLLLPALGLSGATWVGVTLNVLAAGGALIIARAAVPAPDVRPAPGATGRPAIDRSERVPRVAEGDDSHEGAKRPSPTRRRSRRVPRSAEGRESLVGRPWLAAAVLGVSGFASLSLQVVWTRLLAMILGPTTYAFSTIVAIFIAGLAGGAAIASRRAARSAHPLAGLAVCLALAGGLAAGAALLVDEGLLAIASVVARPDATFQTVLLRQALVALGLLAPMTLAFGAAFPFAVAVATRREDTITRDLGLIYAINTTGAIGGALLSGFALIPWLGLHGTIRLVISVCAAAAGGVLLAGARGPLRRRGRVAALALAVGVLATGIWLPPWDRLLLSSGAYKYAGALRGPDLGVALRAGELLYYREGASGTVAVRRLAGATSMAIDGKVDASNAGDMLTQRLLAHVPLLLHPEPARAAILGLGSGVTLGSALTHGLARADVLEISPEVVEASRYFESDNHQALADPRTRLIVGDGRTHLLLTRERYDVIVSEPSNPWMAGIASLFTREFFEAARERLAPGGVLCQWAHTYDISARDLQSIVATFLSVFPHSMLWLVGDGDVLLLGSNDPIETRLAGIADRWQRPGVAEDLASVGVLEPFHLLSLYIAGGQALQAWAAGAPIQTDNRVAIEFSGPRAVFGRDEADNAARLRELAAAYRRPQAVEDAIAAAPAAAWRDRGWMHSRADAFRPAYDDFQRALERQPGDVQALDGLLRAAAPLNRTTETRTLLEKLASDPGNDAAKLALSRWLAANGRFEEALRLPLGLLQRNPGHVAALEQAASILSDAGDTERMAPVVARLRLDAPGSEGAHYYSAALLYMQGRPDLALQEARAVVARNPGHARAQNLMGASLASLGEREQARTAFKASLAADPREAATYTNLATLELQLGNRAAAAQYLAEALTVDPHSEDARRALASLAGG